MEKDLCGNFELVYPLVSYIEEKEELNEEV